MQKTLKNSNTINITPANGANISYNTINPGHADEKRVFSISGKVQLNKPTKVGTIILTAKDNNRFLKKPSIKRDAKNKTINVNSNLEMKLSSVTRDSKNNPTAFTYDLIYTAKEKVGKLKKLKYDLLSSSITGIFTKQLGLDSIECGSENLNIRGEKRKIIVRGVPGSRYEICVLQFENSKGSDGRILSKKQIDILNPLDRARGGTVVDEQGIGVHYGIIPNSGKSVFSQIFPKIKRVIKTAINGSMAASGATKIIFDDLTGVDVGDRVIIGNEVSTVVTLNPDGDNVNECTLFSTITAADDVAATFTRETSYAVCVRARTNDGTSGITKAFNTNAKYWANVENFGDGWYNKIFYQRQDPILIIRATSATSGKITIGPDTSTQTAIDSSNPYDLVFRGKYDYIVDSRRLERRSRSDSESFISKKIKIVLAAVGAGSFTLKSGAGEGAPVFSTSNQNESDWTNSDPRFNGGTKVRISCDPTANRGVVVDNSGSTNYTTITLNLTISKWGTKDVIMAVDLDDIVSVS
jgi:hypothetical protein